MNTAKDLASSPLFADLTEQDLAALASIALHENHSPHTTLCSLDGVGDSIYFIVEGELSVRVRADSGQFVEVHRILAGQLAGLSEALEGVERRTEVVTLSAVQCYRFNAYALMRLLEQRLELGQYVYRRIALALAKQLGHAFASVAYFKNQTL